MYVTVVKVGTGTEPWVPDSRVVELKPRCIDEYGQGTTIHQLTLHGRLILVPKHDRMVLNRMHTRSCNPLTFATATHDLTFSPGTKSVVFNLCSQL